ITCIAVDLDDFFFSSRRRHTIFSRDWSSDVCSSDLLVLEAHLFKLKKLNLKEVDRSALDRYLRASDDRRSKKEHSLDRILRKIVAHRYINFFYTLYLQCGCSNTFYLYSQKLEEKTEILNLIVCGCVLNDGLTWDLCGGHQRVLRDRVTRFIKHYLGRL